MLNPIKINPISYNNIQTAKKFEKSCENYTKPVSLQSYPAVYFLGNVKEIPASKLTQDKLDATYKNYKKSLREISLEQIENTVDELQFSTEFSRKEILEAMQQVTQFGNMKSLIKIGKVLAKNNVGEIAPYKLSHYNITDTFGMNTALSYLIDCKYLYPLDKSIDSVGVFLDDKMLSQLENLKEKNPDMFKKLKNNGKFKFFIATGLENGISFLNREKDLKEETKKLLLKAKENKAWYSNLPINKTINENSLMRAKQLGIKPIVINNNTEPTEENIYKQLRPEQISKKTLENIIDATIKFKTRIHQEQIDDKAFVIDYLYRNLHVITPESLSRYLKITHNKIKQILESQNKTMDAVMYVIPQSAKSFDLINYQYKLVNDIPDEKFVAGYSETMLSKLDLDNKVLVILDDCALSGATLVYGTEIIRKFPKNNTNIIYAPIITSEVGEFEIKKAIKRSNSGQNFLVINKKIKSSDYHKKFDELLGLSEAYESYCLIFPYMCPDNNTKIAATLGYFHNLAQYTPYSDNIYDNIKTFYSENERIIKKMKKDKSS